MKHVETVQPQNSSHMHMDFKTLTLMDFFCVLKGKENIRKNKMFKGNPSRTPKK
jgi:hypothetical protein